MLQVQYGITSSSLIATMRDRASVNETAMSTVRVLNPNIMDVGCLSHALANVSSRFSTTNMDELLVSSLPFVHTVQNLPVVKDVYRQRSEIMKT